MHAQHDEGGHQTRDGHPVGEQTTPQLDRAPLRQQLRVDPRALQRSPERVPERDDAGAAQQGATVGDLVAVPDRGLHPVLSALHDFTPLGAVVA